MKLLSAGSLFCMLVVLAAAGSTAYAQGAGGGDYGMGPGMMHGGSGGSYCPYCGSFLGPRGGYGMGPGMMGGYGGWGHGYGMGPGMMHGWGPGYGRYGQGAAGESCQKFLDETAGLRKELHSKRYEYFEALRNQKSKPEDIQKQEKEIRNLQDKIYAKNPQGCWW